MLTRPQESHLTDRRMTGCQIHCLVTPFTQQAKKVVKNRLMIKKQIKECSKRRRMLIKWQATLFLSDCWAKALDTFTMMSHLSWAHTALVKRSNCIIDHQQIQTGCQSWANCVGSTPANCSLKMVQDQQSNLWQELVKQMNRLKISFD